MSLQSVSVPSKIMQRSPCRLLFPFQQHTKKRGEREGNKSLFGLWDFRPEREFLVSVWYTFKKNSPKKISR